MLVTLSRSFSLLCIENNYKIMFYLYILFLSITNKKLHDFIRDIMLLIHQDKCASSVGWLKHSYFVGSSVIQHLNTFASSKLACAKPCKRDRALIKFCTTARKDNAGVAWMEVDDLLPALTILLWALQIPDFSEIPNSIYYTSISLSLCKVLNAF